MHQFGQHQVAIGRIAALERCELRPGQCGLDGANAVGAFGMALRGLVVGEIGLADQ
ncbi:hypothetical protein D3C87_2028450 [compost metagenome]